MPKCKKYVNTTQLSMQLIEPGRALRDVYEDDSQAKTFARGFADAINSKVTLKRLRKVFAFNGEIPTNSQMMNTAEMMIRSFVIGNARRLSLKQNLLAGEGNRRVSRAEVEEETRERLLNNPAAIYEEMNGITKRYDELGNLAMESSAVADLPALQKEYLLKQKRQHVEQLILFTGYIRAVLTSKAA